MMVKVVVNGIGTIGKRVAHAVKLQDDMELIGISDVAATSVLRTNLEPKDPLYKTDVLIIGGSAGGITAAISARRSYPDKKIVVIRKDDQVVIPCGIPYIIGTVDSVEKDLIPDAILSKNRIEFIVDKVTDINKNQKIIKTINEREIEYERLILATGSLPTIPSMPGINLENVFVVKKNVEHLKNMSSVLKKSKKVVIIGGGFIGIEFADELRKIGIDVTIVEMLPHCLQLVFDEEFCIKAEEKLKERGIKIFTNTAVEEMGGNKKVEYVKLKDGIKFEVDVVLIGIGVKPNVELAKKAGLKIGKTGGILVDKYQRTSNKRIFAVGDCSEEKSFFNKKRSNLKLASTAAIEARIAGSNLFKLKQKNEGNMGTCSTIIGDIGLGVTGLTEKLANELKIKFVKGISKTMDKHPGCMPNTKEIFIKLLFKKSGEIIGGQVYGGSTTAEVTNIIATLIGKRTKIDEVIRLQIGTHPALTPSPVVYPIMNAAEIAMNKVK